MNLPELQNDFSEDSETTRNPTEILRKTQFETIKSIIKLLVRQFEQFDPEQSQNPNGVDQENISLYMEVQRFEEIMIRNALILTGGVQRKAAKLLGMNISTINVKIKRYKIDVSTDKDSDE